jgi:hypothetical protein
MAPQHFHILHNDTWYKDIQLNDTQDNDIRTMTQECNETPKNETRHNATYKMP